MDNKYVTKMEKEKKDLEYRINHRLKYNTKIGIIRNFKLFKEFNKNVAPYYLSAAIISGGFIASGAGVPFVEQPITITDTENEAIVNAEYSQADTIRRQTNSVRYCTKWTKEESDFSREVLYFNFKNIDMDGIRDILENEPTKIIQYMKLIKRETEHKENVVFNREHLKVCSYDFETNKCSIITENKKEDAIFLSNLAYVIMIMVLGFGINFKMRHKRNDKSEDIKEQYQFITVDDIKKLKVKVKIRKDNIKRIRGE